MSSGRSLPLAVVFGLLVGGLVYRFFLPDWYPALGIAAIYAGAAYFYLAFDVSLLGAQIEFTDRSDKAGYAVGLFGLSVSPLALGESVGLRDSAVVGVIVWLLGVIAFLLLATTAAHEEGSEAP
ncbi:hypothetical protein NDI76_15735 [Halogeometricum sp. S1BR25-6]|uniref:Uncharacterized protein n=1 Tax=Halogeometricum salsisoli TaxID=2950536 RepID=A0ABU2GHA0_9EURY|nr:hypothetical protein [Halogeometricum sp. S1BR25-6]MDS0300198.1 hypothetical protein [Halogeometricum sp. S1BR25-6]